MVRLIGIEPTHPAPEAGALSTELQAYMGGDKLRLQIIAPPAAFFKPPIHRNLAGGRFFVTDLQKVYKNRFILPVGQACDVKCGKTGGGCKRLKKFVKIG